MEHKTKSKKRLEIKKYQGSNDICITCGKKLIEGQKYIEIEEDIGAKGKIFYKTGKYHYLCLAKRKYFIAFLDILGFTQLTQTSTLDDLYYTIQNLFSAARASKVKGNIKINNKNYPITLSDIPYVALSDTIIVYQEIIPCPDTGDEFILKERAFGEFVLGMEALFKEAFKRKIFLRGGISFGEAIISLDSDNNENVILGIPYVESVKMEEIQSWMGLAFHPSMSEYLEKTDFRAILVEYKIPVKIKLKKKRIFFWKKRNTKEVKIPNITVGWVDISNAEDFEIFKDWTTKNKREEEIKQNTLKFFDIFKTRASRLTSIGVDIEPI